MATDKNTLKNWFKTGLKPLQAHFWAWLDSYWHKTDTIPQSQIQDLDKTLENKADASALDAKANTDATGLGDENVAKWKEVLGVGEVPDNMATIDKDGVLGDVYDKTQVDALLENSGKNIANADLTTTGARTFTQAHNYTHNTAGYYYYLTGLADKSADTTFSRMRVQDAHGQEAWSNGKVVLENLMPSLPSVKDERTGNYDLNFSEYLVFNPTTRKFAKSDRPQIVSNFNVPSNITIRHDSQVANVNYVAPTTLPEDVKETFNFIKGVESLGYTKVLSSEFVYRKLDNYKFPSSASTFNIPNIEFRDGEMFYNGNNVAIPAGFRDLTYQASREAENALFNVMINKALPSDKNWVFRFRNFQSNLLGTENNSFVGFRRGLSIPGWDITNDLLVYTSGAGSVIKNIRNGKGFGFYRANVLYTNSDFYIIKIGNAISILLLDINTGEIILTTTEYNEDMKYIVFGANLNFSIFSKFYMKDISYWIEP